MRLNVVHFIYDTDDGTTAAHAHRAAPNQFHLSPTSLLYFRQTSSKLIVRHDDTHNSIARLSLIFAFLFYLELFAIQTKVLQSSRQRLADCRYATVWRPSVRRSVCLSRDGEKLHARKNRRSDCRAWGWCLAAAAAAARVSDARVLSVGVTYAHRQRQCCRLGLKGCNS